VNKTLHRAGNALSLPQVQLNTLEDERLVPKGTFQRVLGQHQLLPLRPKRVEILQVNVGKVCNQTCAHCHVDAGPDRRENMSRETAEQVVRLLEAPSIHTLDITGGAPEMNPNFRHLVEQGKRHNKHVIDRCNLTILLAPGFTDLPHFLADNRVEVVASLPCYLEENCDAQRGDGTFRKSVLALQELNALGYGKAGTGLTLSLVYNPVGPSLPPDQQKLEAAYRDQLWSRFRIEFTRLFTITNMPISRFLDDLLQSKQYETYMQKLIDAFNPAAVESVMCRNTLSVDWRGNLYDCDFNQMLDLPLDGSARHISEISWAEIDDRHIALGNHCFGCTAGSGSSCQGTIA
jgi:radical SAM/Cys-rich protein